MENFLDQYGYFALLIGSFFEGEAAILVASSLIHTGVFEGPYTVLVAFAGSFISDWLYYLIGRLNGKYFIQRRPKLQARVQPVTDFFLRHKLQILFSYRFLYGFRVIIPLVIGMSGLKPVHYLFYSIVTGLIWATTVSVVGYGVGRVLNLTTAIVETNILFIIVGFAAVGVAIGFMLRTIVTRNMKAEQL